MEVTVFLPYYDYNDGAFDVNHNYYNEEEYSKIMEDEYNKNKDIIFNSMTDAKNGSGTLVGTSDAQTYKFGEKTSQNAEKVAFSSCQGILYDENGDKESVDNFIEKFARQKQFVEMLELDGDTSEEEFETEMSLWMKEHSSINSYMDKLGEEWVWMKEPQRNVKVRFKNKANEEINAILENCKIMDIIEGNTFILFVEKVTLVDN